MKRLVPAVLMTAVLSTTAIAQQPAAPSPTAPPPAVPQAQEQPPSPAAPAQQDPKAEDCAFLERSFQEVYDGLRAQTPQAQPASAETRPSPETVRAFVDIQRNIILLHQARGCDAAKLVAIAREEAARRSTGR